MKPSLEINIIEGELMPHYERERASDDDQIRAKIEAIIIYLDNQYESKHRLKHRKN